MKHIILSLMLVLITACAYSPKPEIIYYDYIANKDKLEKMVEDAFNSESDKHWNNIAAKTSRRISGMKTDVGFDRAIVDVVLD